MRHYIDPCVDYPFKAILGAEENRDILIDFLNALLQLKAPIVDVEILNPFTPAEYEDSRAGIVDVKARDSLGRIFQVEIQNRARRRLIPRILCNWADLYPSQLHRGGDYVNLRPLYSLWLLNENLLPAPDRWHHVFELRDRVSGHLLTDHLEIHTVELKKWSHSMSTLDPESRWIYFLKEAGAWTALPPEADTPALRKAMAVLDRISDKQLDYQRYLSRLDFERDQRSIEHEKDIAEQEKATAEQEKAIAEQEKAIAEQEKAIAEQEKAVAEQEKAVAQQERAVALREKHEVEHLLEAERAEKDHARAEADRLRARLRALGIDTDSLQ